MVVALFVDAHRGRGAPHVPPIKFFEKLPHINAIKHDFFITTPSTPLKRICQKNPKPLDFQLLCIYGSVCRVFSMKIAIYFGLARLSLAVVDMWPLFRNGS
jgi:hypothetical protein